jgi:hypothetical protein
MLLLTFVILVFCICGWHAWTVALMALLVCHASFDRGKTKALYVRAVCRAWFITLLFFQSALLGCPGAIELTDEKLSIFRKQKNNFYLQKLWQIKK